MSTANQQTLAESSTDGRPPRQEKGSYVSWASRFLRFLDNKKEEGELMRYLIDNVPLKWNLIDYPKNPCGKNAYPMIYNSVNTYKDAQGMWQRDNRLMQGTNLSKQERHSRLMNEFDKFFTEASESLTSVYERFSILVNNMDQNKIKPSKIVLNTKFLNSLQPKWSKYVTLTCQSHTLSKEHFDKLYDYLSQCEPYVNASRAKRNAKNHDPLDLVANSYANPLYSYASPLYSRLPQPYYNQVVIQDGRMDIQSKKGGYARNDSRNTGRLNGNQATTDGNSFPQKNVENEENVQRIPRTTSTLGKTNLEELNALVIMMARIQAIDNKSDAEPTYDAEFINEDNSGQVEHDQDAHDNYCVGLESLINNVHVEAENHAE
ncbi:hypothetical protein Tco_1156263 [Tanacetum coccineum]